MRLDVAGRPYKESLGGVVRGSNGATQSRQVEESFGYDETRQSWIGRNWRAKVRNDEAV